MRGRFVNLFIGSFLVLAVYGQDPSTLGQQLSSQNVTTQVRALIEVRNLPADERLISPLLKALDSQDPTVLREAVKTWALIYREYHDVLAEAAQEFDYREPQYNEIWNRIYGLQSRLLERCIVAAHSPVEATRVEGIHALCSFGGSPEEFLGPLRFRCGLGQSQTLASRSQVALRALDSATLMAFLDDPDPIVAYRMHSILKPKYTSDWLPKIKKYIASDQKDFQGLGLFMLTNAPVDTRLNVVSPLLKSKEFLTSAAFFLLLNSVSESNFIELAQPRPNRPTLLRTFAVSRLSRTSTWLKTYLHDAEPQVRVSAMNRLLGYEDVIDFTSYRNLLEDSSPQVRGAALRRAAKAKAPGLLPYLKLALTSPDKNLREDGMIAFRDIKGSADFTPELIDAAAMGNSRIFSIYPPFDDPRFSKLLDKCLESPSGAVRYLALNYLSKSASQNITRLKRLTTDSDREIAYHATLGLFEASNDAFIEAASRLVGSASVSEAEGLCVFLPRTNLASAIPVLKILTHHECEKVQRDARKAVRVMEKKLRP